MAEEVKVETTETVTEPSFTETELSALSMGWKPQDQWEGEPDKWIPAKEFVDRKSLFDKIDHQSRRLKDMEKTLTDFKKHYEGVEINAYQRALNDLKKQKRQALEEDDTKTALVIEDQIDQVQQEFYQHQQQKQTQQKQGVTPSDTFVSWLKQNNWYAADTELNGVADGIGIAYHRSRPGVSEQEVLDHVSREIRKRYPEKFPTNAARTTPSPVDSAAQRSGAKGGVKLPAEAEEIMNRFVKAGVMTREQYMKDWATMNKGE